MSIKSKKDQLISKIFAGLEELSERITDPTLAQILLQTLLATNSLSQELTLPVEADVDLALVYEVGSESEVDQAVVAAVAAGARFNLTLMTLGQIKNLYPEVRGVVSDAGLVEFSYLLDRYSPEYLFKDYIEAVYRGDYFGRWDHYVDRNNVINI